MGGFTGFGLGFFGFFTELKQNNERDWFNANKQRYEDEVVAPLMDFIEAMQEPLEKVSPQFLAVPKKTGGSMFRIYRDVRFSKDKRPYKEHAAVQFRHELGRDAHAPGFYVHLEPGNIRYGGGVWTPAADRLKLIREAIYDERSDWGEVVGDARLQRNFDEIRGDTLKRPPRDFDKDHPFIDDIKRKSFFLMKPASEAEAASPSFVGDVAKGFHAAAPMMRFLCKALDVPY